MFFKKNKQKVAEYNKVKEHIHKITKIITVLRAEIDETQLERLEYKKIQNTWKFIVKLNHFGIHSQNISVYKSKIQPILEKYGESALVYMNNILSLEPFKADILIISYDALTKLAHYKLVFQDIDKKFKIMNICSNEINIDILYSSYYRIQRSRVNQKLAELGFKPLRIKSKKVE